MISEFLSAPDDDGAHHSGGEIEDVDGTDASTSDGDGYHLDKKSVSEE